MLRATTACSFFISHLASRLGTRRFSEPTFRPPEPQSLEKHNVSRLSYLFGHLHLLSSDSFSSLIFSLLLFSSLFFCSTSAFHLVHIVGSLTSKLPSNNLLAAVVLVENQNSIVGIINSLTGNLLDFSSGMQVSRFKATSLSTTDISSTNRYGDRGNLVLFRRLKLAVDVPLHPQQKRAQSKESNYHVGTFCSDIFVTYG